MDITELSLGQEYRLILLPFNSLSEITDAGKHKRTLQRIYEHLTEDGEFICTLHNPKIRLQTIDGTSRLMGGYRIDNEK